MRTFVCGSLVAASLLAWSASAQAVVIAYWDFNDGNLVADQGTGTITPTLLNNVELGFAAGTTANALPGVVAGQALRITKSPGPASSQYQLDIALDLSGFETIQITMAVRGDPSWASNPIYPDGFPIHWFPSVDGGTSFLLGRQVVPDSDFTTHSIVQTSFASLAGHADAVIRTSRSFSSSLGVEDGDGWYLDNLLITGTAAPQSPAVSEPGTLMALGFGLAALGFIRRRRAA